MTWECTETSPLYSGLIQEHLMVNIFYCCSRMKSPLSHFMTPWLWGVGLSMIRGKKRVAAGWGVTSVATAKAPFI